jgi:hypothetical protein
MFKISLVLALVSIPALAAPQVSEHERALQKASKWADVTAQLKGRLPSNVVKEFSEFAAGVEFPSSRRIKNKLVLTQNDGTKVTIEYKKDGAISLNGKDWKLKPLATVEEEVTRLALFLNGEKKAESSLFGLVPAAQAGGAGSLGAAAAAFAGANAWKAESCGEEEIQGDLVNDCPLMAVKMRPILVKAKAVTDPEKLMPVNLKCPADNRGVLELVSKNLNGQSERIKVKYDGKKPVAVTVDMAERSAAFEEFFSVDIFNSTEDYEIESAKAMFKVTNPLLEGVCLGTKKAKKRYFAALEANRSDLSTQSSQETSTGGASIEAL